MTEKRPKKYRMGQKDTSDLAVLVVYTVQTVGEMSISEIKDKLRNEFNVTVHDSTLKNTVIALKKKDLLSVNHRVHDGSTAYSIAKVRFSGSTTELAHVKNVTEILTKLKGETAGVAVLATLGDAEKAAAKEKNKQQHWPKDWCRYDVTIKLLRPMLGGHPLSAPLKKEYLKSEHRDETLNLDEDPLVFERGPEGELIIGKNCVKNFFRDGLSSLGIAHTTINLWRFGDVHIVPGLGVTSKYLPIQRAETRGGRGKNEGAGLKWYEALPPGTVINFAFFAPTTNYISPEQLQAWCEYAFEFNARSISPARGTQYGAAKLVGFEHAPAPWLRQENPPADASSTEQP
jgi:hypothetical protein